MKVFISTDFEGVAGIVDWDQIMVGSSDYEMGRRLLLGELNAAIDGALAGGATEFVVNDSHSSMRNLPPDLLHGQARLITGKHKPMYMMEGLDASFDAILFLGYHGSIGASQSVLSHTYNPRAIWEVRIDGEIAGETALNACIPRPSVSRSSARFRAMPARACILRLPVRSFTRAPAARFRMRSPPQPQHSRRPYRLSSRF
jgi:D-amino peptidase